MSNNQKELDALRHSAAHLLAAAVLKIFPDAKPTIGPAIDTGFYYDFDFGESVISADLLPQIENEMRQIINNWTQFDRIEVNQKEALKAYANNLYKQELINEFAAEGQVITLYKAGDFTDLCRGGHVDNPSKLLKYFKLLSIAGAYWRGDETKPMLTRIYGTAFFTQVELNQHLKLLEEAKKRDHRKIGQELDLFTISEEVGAGLAIWLPKGNVIKEELESWAKSTEKAWGYQSVSTPHITKEELYYTSGHLPYYQDDMFPAMVLDKGQNYYLKPMNCPHHHMVYKARPRSYRDLPLRLAEYGMCYRYEASGELFGLMRVRGLDINDAHIYCTVDQAVDEFVSVMRLHEYYYQSLGIEKYHLEIALRDPAKKDKYHGDEKMWELAENLMRKAVDKVDIEMVEEEGSAAFYGPKIDFIVHSSIGREFAVSTNQIDLYMGKRFGLEYTDETGQKQTPTIIHRAPLGSHERFIGFLIEHFAGAFPIWLSPVQVVIIPISDKHLKHAKHVQDVLAQASLRTEIWDQSESIGKKIRNAEKQKIPFTLVLGDKESQNNKLSVRARGEQTLGSMTLSKFTTAAKLLVTTKSLNLDLH